MVSTNFKQRSPLNCDIIMKENDVLFAVTVEDLQNEALDRTGRILTDDEINIAQKGSMWGLGDVALVSTYNTIFTEMIKGK